MDIRILPSNIANMIAAGEVVQRPASVVKELMENAVDAGASQISVIIRDAGRTLIQVIDNGCGMSPDQAVLAFERHATSKITTAEDLASITTFGFRGEALASIAAVAEVSLKTRRESDELGCQVDFADSRHISTVETATPTGSNFQVRNLFYNVPARRKFLKSDSVEFKHIVTEFQHVAFTCPEISFKLVHNDREICVLKAVPSLKFRIQDIVGAAVASEIVDLSANTSVVDISGFAGRPDKARKVPGYQLFFVNGRFFRSPYLHKAVMKAYEDTIPDGTAPSYFIFLETDPHRIDVNIHPTKAEVKFEDDSLVFQTLYACVREALGRNSFGGAIDFDISSAQQMPSLGQNFEEYRSLSEPSPAPSDYNPFDNDGFPNEAMPDAPSSVSRQGARYSSVIDRTQDYGALFDDTPSRTPAVGSNFIISGKYVVTNSRTGIMVIHSRRAMERILFDRFINTSAESDSLSQAVLFPVQMRVGVENLEIFKENDSLLKAFGFDIAPFGTDTVVVNAVPAGFPSDESRVESTVSDLLLLLQDSHSGLSTVLLSETAGKFALLGASSYEGPKSPAEASALVESLLSGSNPEYTSSGRRIMYVIAADELDSKF
ncbi:MAG: DNA mismatch repair endonuclease MutL [Candidatus Cryptobacteroides sp.]